MMNEFFDLSAWREWFVALDREYIFLLALPFVVAVIGLWSSWVDKEDIEREREYEARAAQATEAERRKSERRRSERRSGAHIHGLR